MQAETITQTIRAYFAAYESKNRPAIEELLTADFTFTSPRDDRIDRERYLAKCWPESERLRSFEVDKIFISGAEAFVHYTCQPTRGTPFENVEFFRCHAGKVREVVCYFGNCDRGHASAA
jgi:ketosteroid isomerase-like protein